MDSNAGTKCQARMHASSAPGPDPGQAQHGGDADDRLAAWQSTLGLHATPAARPVPPDTTGLAMQCEPVEETVDALRELRAAEAAE